jgi:hypothetical protein
MNASMNLSQLALHYSLFLTIPLYFALIMLLIKALGRRRRIG